MKKYLVSVGIDVSKLKLDVTLLLDTSEKRPVHFIVGNNLKGLKELVSTVQKLKIPLDSVLFSFEDTGVYSSPLCCFFSEQHLDYWMIPAIEIKRSKGLSRGKNDKSDSKDIAFYAFTHMHKLRLGQLPEKSIMKLRLLFTEREKLMKAIRLLESTKESIGFISKDVLSTVLKINASNLKKLKKSVLQIEEEMNNILVNNDRLKLQNELIQSIPGIGPQTAIYLILVTKSFSSFDNWRQLACYAGVAPFEYSSGSSIRGRTKVSPLADKKLKSLLNMCALNAKKYDQELKEYYDRKVNDGKSKMLVLNNVRCKLLARVFAVVNRGNGYINTKKFAS